MQGGWPRGLVALCGVGRGETGKAGCGVRAGGGEMGGEGKKGVGLGEELSLGQGEGEER